MLAVNTYTPEYIEECRTRFASALASYRAVEAAVRGAGAKALADFEPSYFNDQVILLDAAFVHRTRALEGKDGNPMNEVRILTTSLLSHGGVMTAEKAIKLDPAASVLHYEFGAPIRLNAEDFEAMAEAFFAELERRYR